ncbi:MAG: DUF4157 domain-containing protein [Acidobacteriota bacterium]
MPDQLKIGIEALSGESADDVKVHYNSAKPAQIHALAYAQGNQIHIGPGNESYLPHEAWHVMQQKQGRVEGEQRVSGAWLNENPRLEREAFTMGERAQSVGAAITDRYGVDVASDSRGARGFAVRGGVIQAVYDSEESNGDHESAPGSAEEIIDWSDLTQQAQRLPDEVLKNVFLNLAEYHYEKAGQQPKVDLNAAFGTWLNESGVTRARFKELIGLQAVEDDDGKENIIQPARTPHTYSVNSGYTGTSNGVEYENVIYYRDDKGNIDFGEDPTTKVDGFNDQDEVEDELDAADIAWQDPVDHDSYVQMNNDLSDNDLGVMPSGKSVHLPTASRAQHFAIADMLYDNNRQGTWTWHHLTPEYYMVLVDMRVHAKHGHNGGVHLWK